MSKEKSKNKKKFGSDKYSVENYQNKIITFFKKTEKAPYPHKELAAKCRSVKGNEKITKRRSLNFYRTEQYANAAEAL